MIEDLSAAIRPNLVSISNPVRSDDSQGLAVAIAQAADDRKGGNILILQVIGISYLADYFVLVTGFSRAQVRAIAAAIQDRAQQQWQRSPRRTEGQADGTWILQDYGDVIVHIFLPQQREFYNLEAFWGHAERIPFAPTPGS
ncbi:hypothetical protein DO97_21160 [Neosynechococcus sphagnicola sy1]|uniref:Ribosomal silencing factor RsfS n=1 Tax=Neosynechococcus sphagnicola sy1 TaxID=1497020 RepID=A0A098TLY9_9CYAN|nr:ribosome silencing factor [Neosynechococcus sphagnicola]KGF73324.1 hypothetical protein DO97_21160 [Neosynechococcus sphagnicola sy1]